MAQTTRNAAWKRKRFERQRREAIEREQIERCYKQHTPPQIRYCNDVVKP